MSVDFSEIHYGRIVWAIVRDAHGYRKRRPAVILTPEAEISRDQPLIVMAVTTTYPDPPKPDFIELPWSRDPRRVSTGLARRSAAVTTWLDTAYADEIDGIIGTAPSRVMEEIQRRLRPQQDADA